MAASEQSATKPGLRERKKRRTRETIAKAALRLFAERGYDRTTLADIAEAADVSTRTIFSYFDSKEEILFCDEEPIYELLKHKLETRPPGANTVDALREFMADLDRPDENAILRKKIVQADEHLRLSERARLARAEELLVDSIAKDLDARPDDIRPRLVAASMTAAFGSLSDRLAAESGESISHEQMMGIVDEVLEFLRGGLEAMRHRSRNGE
jgi:AcrR family transcriptional regulator